MGKNKKPRKPYVPNHIKAQRVEHSYNGVMKSEMRQHYIKQIAILNTKMDETRLDYAFKPLESAVDEIEATGECYTDERGLAIFLPYEDEGIWYPLADALNSACVTFGRLGSEEDVAGLRRLSKRLELGMPIFPEDTRAARESFKRMRAIAATMTPNELMEIQRRQAEEVEASQSKSAQ